MLEKIKKNQGIIYFGLSVILLITIFGNHAIDEYFADLIFDTQAKQWHLRENWWLTVFLHEWAKYFTYAIIFITFIIKYNQLNKPTNTNNQHQKTRWFCALTAVILIPLVISILKKLSSQHCPWDYIRYGGFLLIEQLSTAPPGKCFPAGHASTGFAWMGLGLFWMPGNKKRLMLFAIGIFFGLILGIGQQFRGAHFLSHTLWSMWIACFLCYLVEKTYSVIQSRKHHEQNIASRR